MNMHVQTYVHSIVYSFMCICIYLFMHTHTHTESHTTIKKCIKALLCTKQTDSNSVFVCRVRVNAKDGKCKRGSPKQAAQDENDKEEAEEDTQGHQHNFI